MSKPIYGFYSGCNWNNSNIASIDFTKMDYCVFEYLQATGTDDDTLILQEGTTALLTEFVAHAKADNPSIKLELCYADGLSGTGKNFHLIKDATHRASIVSQLHTWMDTYGFDGINLDVEYSPIKSADQIVTPAEYDTFMADVRTSIGAGKVLSACLRPMEALSHNNFTTTGEAQLDHNLMMNYTHWVGTGALENGFDALPEWYQYTGGSIRGSWQALYKDIIISIQLAITDGFSASKLFMGIPLIFYPDNKGIWKSWKWIVDSYAADGLTLTDNIDEWQGANYGTSYATPWDKLGGVSIYNNHIWFNNLDTVKQKADYVKSGNLGGVMLYEVGSDSFDSHNILNAVYNELQNTTTPPAAQSMNARKLALIM